MVVHLLCGLVPVDGAHGFVQHGGVGGLFAALRRPVNLPLCCKAAQGFAQQVGSQHCQTIQQLPGSLILPNGSFGHLNDVSGIHLPAQVHGGDTGFLQAVQHRPLVGSGTPVLGQNAGVNVDAAEGGDIQYLLGQDPAIGHHGTDIRLQIPKLLHTILLPEVLRLKHGDSMLQRHFLHRRKDHLHAPTLGAVGLGKGPHHLKAVGKDFFQAGRRDIRRSHKHNTHDFSPSFAYSPASSSSSVRNRSMTSVYTMPSR